MEKSLFKDLLQSLKQAKAISRGMEQHAFLARGLASREAGKLSGKYVEADIVLLKLAAKIEKAGG